jgi:hypothetical protein
LFSSATTPLTLAVFSCAPAGAGLSVNTVAARQTIAQTSVLMFATNPFSIYDEMTFRVNW